MTGKSETFVPFRCRRRQSQWVDTEHTVHEPGLLRTFGRALYWQTLLDEVGSRATARSPNRKCWERSMVTRLLPLALLAASIIEQCLAGQQPRTLTLRWLQRHRLPIDWRAQQQIMLAGF